MADFQIKSAQLSASDGPKAPLVRTELLNMPNGDGKIFGLIKILGRKDETRTNIAQAIQEQLIRFQETLDDNTNIARRFEQVLQAVNENIAKVIEEGKRVPISDFHAVIGVTHKQQVFLAGAGNSMALFMHRTAKQRFSVYELDAQFSRGEHLTWQKPFVTVLDGELNRGDILYIATRVSSREISLAELQDVLVMLPPSGALERIQQHLKIGTPFGAVCFRVREPNTESTPKKVNPLHSIEQLGKTREDTAQTLGEQSPDFSTWLQKRVSPILTKLSAPGTKGWKTILRRIVKSLIKLATAAAVFVVAFSSRIWQVIRRTAGKFKTNKTSDNEVPPPATEASAKKSPLAFVQNLPKQSKYAAAGVLLVLLLIVGSVVFSGNNNQRKESELAFTSTISTIEEKRDAAEASLIYKDDAQARELLNEALALLETLQAETKSQEDEVNRVRTELNTVFEAMKGISDVQLTSLASIDSGNIVDIVEGSEGIIAVTREKNTYRFNSLDNTFEGLDLTIGSLDSVTAATASEEAMFVADIALQVGRIDTTSGSLNPVVSGLGNLSDVADIANYNGNIYALTANAQQIVRMRPAGDGFDAGTNWITANSIDITSARSLTIDGDIYVLLASTIVKYTTGAQQPLEFDVVDPAMRDPVQIWTTVGSEYLYVLEPAERRILIFEKTGNFLTQYTADIFTDAQSITVRESENTIYVATSNTLHSFTAEHLLQ